MSLVGWLLSGDNFRLSGWVGTVSSCGPASEMTFIVSSGALNSTPTNQPIQLWCVRRFSRHAGDVSGVRRDVHHRLLRLPGSHLPLSTTGGGRDPTLLERCKTRSGLRDGVEYSVSETTGRERNFCLQIVVVKPKFWP